MNDQSPGTVYGRGGVDVRPPGRSSLHPAVIALVATAALVAVAALGYGLLRDPDDDPAQVAPAAVPAVSSPAAPASASASPSPAPELFRAGTWLLRPAGDQDAHLGRKDDFATLTASGDPEPLTVVPGLADKACFSVRDSDGEYLRHFNYRLRFDGQDDSDLYRADATFCAKGDQSAGKIQLFSKNYPAYQLHRRGSELYIDKPDGSAKFLADSTFTAEKSR